MGGGRIPNIGGGMAPGGISMGGIPGAPGKPGGNRFGRGGFVRLGGGMPTPGGLTGPVANGFWFILPALNAAVVASIRCWACSSIHFW